MLDDPGADLRDLEHLTARHGDHRSASEPVTTPGTRGRLMQHSLVRDLDLPQRPALMPTLATHTAPRTPTQRLRCGLVQTLNRGRHVRIAWSLTQPAPQLSVLRFQRLDPGIPRRNRLLQRDEPLQQLHDRRSLRHPDILPGNPHQDQTGARRPT